MVTEDKRKQAEAAGRAAAGRLGPINPETCQRIADLLAAEINQVAHERRADDEAREGS